MAFGGRSGDFRAVAVGAVTVADNARLVDHAILAGTATLGGRATLSGRATANVTDAAAVGGHAWLHGSAHVTGEAWAQPVRRAGSDLRNRGHRWVLADWRTRVR